jgi:ubiquitin C-terminal hydrolase
MPPRALVSGLVNVGNSCWLSAAVLLLTQLPPTLWRLVGSHSHPILQALKQLQSARWVPTTDPHTCDAAWVQRLQANVAAAKISDGYGCVGVQHDPTELVEFVVSTLLADDNTTQTQINSLLGRTVCTITNCRACSKTLLREDQREFLMHLTVPAGGRPVMLADCITAAREAEVLQGRCDCSDGADVTLDRRAYETMLPRALIVLLKRTGATGNKLRTTVKVPLDLSIMMRAPDSRQTVRYQLHGVVQHQGMSTKSGHYVYFGAGTTSWQRYDDAVVTEPRYLDPAEVDRDAVMALYLPISAGDGRSAAR